jgi:hypothetical protein
VRVPSFAAGAGSATVVRSRPAVADAKPRAKPKPAKSQPATAARGSGPARGTAPTGKTPVWVVVLAVLGLVMLMLLIVLAVVAIPAYRDYTARAAVAEALVRAQPARMTISERALADDHLPEVADELDGFIGGPLAAIQWRDGLLQLTLNVDGVDAAAATVALEPFYDEANDVLVWRCGFAPVPARMRELTDADSATATTLPSRLLPASCR